MTAKDDEASPMMIACSNDVSRVVTELVLQHDIRLLYSCFLAEAAHMAALLREANIYSPHMVARSFAEGLATAMTYKSAKPPTIMYTDGDTPLGSKQ